MQMEKGKKRTHGNHGKKLRIGVPTESEEALFRDVMVLDDVISEMEKDLREAGKDLWQVILEWRRIKVKERRETDAGGDVTWKAASAKSSMAGDRTFWRVRGWRQLERLGSKAP